MVDLKRLPLAPPHLYVIAPGQVHHWQDCEGVAGWVLLFNEDFLLPHPEDVAALHALAAHLWCDLDPGEAARFEALLAAMDEEYRGAGFVDVLACHLHVLLIRAMRACGVGAPGGRGGARTGDLAARFARLAALPGPRDRSVLALARELGISAGHLHEAVKQATGRTPGRLIREQQTLEAKRLIAGTDLTVRQIATQVGFLDAAYFCRFFRRETGLSPGEFRRAIRGNHHDPAVGSIAGAAPPA